MPLITGGFINQELTFLVAGRHAYIHTYIHMCIYTTYAYVVACTSLSLYMQLCTNTYVLLETGNHEWVPIDTRGHNYW